MKGTCRAMTVYLLAVSVSVGMAAEPFDENGSRGWLSVADQKRYQESAQGGEQVDRFSRAIKLGRTGVVDLSNTAGNVVVTGGGGDEIRIEAVKRVRHRHPAEAKRQLAEIRIEVAEFGTRVEIRTVYPKRTRTVAGTVDYTVEIPFAAGATIRTVSGNVRVTNVRGKLRLESTSGSITTSSAARLASVKSASGDVEITDSASEGEMTVITGSGDLTATRLTARAVVLESVRGDITLRDLQCRRASVKSMSGRIEYTGSLARKARYEMNSHSGDVRFALTDRSGFEVEASTFSGNVRSDFPLTVFSEPNADDLALRRRRNRSIRGSYGDAGTFLSLQSFSGDIIVTSTRRVRRE